MLAAQLSNVDGELGEGQRSELMKIYNKFKEIIEQNKKCKSDLKALKGPPSSKTHCGRLFMF